MRANGFRNDPQADNMVQMPSPSVSVLSREIGLYHFLFLSLYKWQVPHAVCILELQRLVKDDGMWIDEWNQLSFRVAKLTEPFWLHKLYPMCLCVQNTHVVLSENLSEQHEMLFSSSFINDLENRKMVERDNDGLMGCCEVVLSWKDFYRADDCPNKIELNSSHTQFMAHPCLYCKILGEFSSVMQLVGGLNYFQIKSSPLCNHQEWEKLFKSSAMHAAESCSTITALAAY